MSNVHLREAAAPRDINSPVLITERLVLRLPHNEDIDALARLAHNKHISAQFGKMPYPFTRADAEEFIRRAASGKIGYYVYAITRADTGEFIGCCGIGAYKSGAWAASDAQVNMQAGLPPRGGNQAETEVFFWLGEPFWGQGYGEEVATALVDVAFRATDIETLYARANMNNGAMRRILQKCGFSLIYAGGHVAAGADKGEAIAHYHLSRTAWLDLRGHTAASRHKTKKADVSA